VRPTSGHRLYVDDDGRTVDRFGRDLVKVRSSAEAAARIADLTATLSQAAEASVTSGLVELGQVAGPKLLWRYAWNAHLFGVIAERDNEIAELLERAAAEDAAAASGGNGR